MSINEWVVFPIEVSCAKCSCKRNVTASGETVSDPKTYHIRSEVPCNCTHPWSDHRYSGEAKSNAENRQGLSKPQK